MGENNLDEAVMDVVCGVIDDGAGRVLACRRAEGMSQGGLWELPGDKIEDGETPEGALRRELDEELGIDVEVGARLAAVDHDYGKFSIRLIAQHCRITSGIPEAREHAEIQWVTAVEAAALGWAPADQKLVRLLAGSWDRAGRR